MDLQWRDVAVDVPGKRILHTCSGSLGPGRMVALMGPSGSGKTTLLSTLRHDIAHHGQIHYDGKPFTPKLRQSIGFVEQEDVVISAMTVRASLQFLAQLRFGSEATDRVDKLLCKLKLEEAADTVIGEQNAAEKISGGQKKRLCIARELLSDPRLLMCDEPTSGLDSTMAEQVVDSMRQLCDAQSVSVMASIHQPSTHIFEQFDDVILLKHGEVVYYGPIANLEHVFTAHGPARMPLQSVAEYAMDCLVLEREPSLRVSELVALFARESALLPSLEPVAVEPELRQAAPFLRQVMVLFRRHSVLVKAGMITRQNICLNVGLMLIAALLWFRLETDVKDLQPRFAICQWTCGTWMFLPIFGGTGTFAAEGEMVRKELKAGNYALLSYYLARTLMLIPLDLVWPTIWVSGVFWMTNLNPSLSVFVIVLASVFLAFTVFQAVGLMIAASGMPPDSAATFAVLMITYFFAWTPLLMDLRRVPSWLHFAKDANIFNKAVEMVFSFAMKDMEFVCGPATDLSQAKLGCEDGIVIGEEARARLGITSSPLHCFLILLACGVVFRLAAFGILRYNLRGAIEGAKVIASQEDSGQKQRPKCAQDIEQCGKVGHEIEEYQI